MDPLLIEIRRDPLAYLPEVSLSAFGHFRSGYGFRCAVEGAPHDWQFDGRAFWEWLAAKYQLKGADALNDISIVSSFSENDAQALEKYFELLEEFSHEHPTNVPRLKAKPEHLDFTELLKAIRRRPPLYLGHASFRALRAYLMGDSRACRDLQLPDDDGRKLFREFTTWVEVEKNRGLRRPWYKVIEFWSGGVDCGHNPKSGAFTLFFHWLDQYAEKVGRPAFFGLEQTTRE